MKNENNTFNKSKTHSSFGAQRPFFILNFLLMAILFPNG